MNMQKLSLCLWALVVATSLSFNSGCGQAAAPAPAAQANAAPAPAIRANAADVVRLRKVGVVDNQVFGRAVEAMSLLVPVGWSFKGEMPIDLNTFQWCPENSFKGRFEAQSADGLLAISSFPMLQTMHFANPILAEDARRRQQMGQGFCTQLPPMDLGQFINQVLVPAYRPGARLLGVQPAPDLQQSVQQQIAATPLPPNARVNGEGADVVIGYSVNGKEVEEHIYVMAGWRGESVSGGSGPDIIYSLYTPIIGLRVPTGQFVRHQKQFASIIATLRMDSHFVAAISGAVQQQRSNIFNNILGQISRESQIWRQAWQQANDSAKQREASGSSQRAYDVAGAWSDTILDVQNYKDVNGESVQLSGGYSHVFSNRNGEYILTNDSSYDPAVATGSRWEPISAIPR
jgi:hypothetical protein